MEEGILERITQEWALRRGYSDAIRSEENITPGKRICRPTSVVYVRSQRPTAPSNAMEEAGSHG